MDLVIVCFIDNPPSSIFQSSQWPMHMTLIPPFSYDGSINELNELLSNFSKEFIQFSVTASERALFGPNKDIPVTIIKQNEVLQGCYIKLLNLIEKLGIKYKYPSISGQNYHFHITDKRGIKVPTNSDILLTGFSLVDRQVKGQPGIKQVIKTLKFVEK